MHVRTRVHLAVGLALGLTAHLHAQKGMGLGLGYGAGGAADALAALQGAAGGVKVLVFGGANNSVYLGCLTCPQIAADAVTNEIGRYGSPIAANSITNKIGRYGSEISTTSVCNPLANHPPVLVDGDGAFYGELTVNDLRPNRVQSPTVRAWLAAMCRAR